MGTRDTGHTALIVGLGVSGIATAIRLRQIGWTPVIIEKSPVRRSGGYFIALFGAGRAPAGRLGILDDLHDRWPDGTTYMIDRNGRKSPGLGFNDFPGPPWTMMRGDVERAAFAALPPDVEIRYGTVPAQIEQDEAGVDVTTTDIATGNEVTERFDLVIGADGLRSTVRQMVFGPHSDYLHPMNTMAVAFQMPAPLPGYQRHDSLMLAEPHRSMWVFPLSDQPPTVALSYRTDDIEAEFGAPMRDRVRKAFGPEPTGAVLGAVIDALDEAEDVLFDSVAQVKMSRWSRGRVLLLGDAAWCVTLYSGMGASTGLAGADLLGTMLHRHPQSIGTALDNWERQLRPAIEQLGGVGDAMRSLFVPDNERQLLLGRAMGYLNTIPIASTLLARLRNSTQRTKIKDLDFARPDPPTSPRPASDSGVVDPPQLQSLATASDSGV